jgi:hypothetical protein
MGLLNQIRVVRSSDPDFREAACQVPDFFWTFRTKGKLFGPVLVEGALKLHAGGDSFVTLPETAFTTQQISPTRDTRFHWMQSVVNCSHYILGAGEMNYLHPEQTPEIIFINRDPIDRSDEAYTELS